ncbi:hypothetical protein ACSU6B_12085 [Neobacillus sp. C211]|jgi:hypothetical protein|uniref:Uncharacterized protein n=1 Tax=Priestia megaterium TaxID=1404 RepID=A0A6H1P799_PRIMG|nr:MULTISPECIES: hypothetical protein [Bacillaceae]MBT2698731.1 hypothetical protein [Bacillus sp. ISL-40]MBT2720823.1 hypothetical protein [Bacillus sp. ISL-46]MBT2725761.1 hypothetical protein [Bacillus sp. ISL-75]MBT2737575.1 hypothetical protein [Bacillus sp. ISL-7]MBT2740897.1 hypothetical protein [Bacillus sp. ISL-77]
MSNWHLILSGIALLVLIGGLIFTLGTGRMVSTRSGEFDTQINEKTQRHPYLLNPVFLVWIIAIAAIIIYIIYLGFNYY